MPSLPELEVYKQHLTAELAGRTVTQVEPLDFRVVHATSEALEQYLLGHHLTGFNRYGKWFMLGTDAPLSADAAPAQLIVHLGLTGKLHLLEAADSEALRYACLVLHFDDGRRLALTDQRHLGKVYIRNFADLKAEKALGPDLLELAESNFTALGRKNRAVRDVLMDQKLIAGIGGKYADEMLWQAKIHPHAKMNSLSSGELTNLYRLARQITDTAIGLGADVERLPGDWLIPHRHTDKICPRCQGPLEEHASVFHCPHCQPAPSPLG